jgi:mRNA interferase RelE/StbE
VHRVTLKRPAQKGLDKLQAADVPTWERALDAIAALAESPRPTGTKKLHGGSRYRIRVGDYRIVYTVDDRGEAIEILDVGPRRDIYRRFGRN